MSTYGSKFLAQFDESLQLLNQFTHEGYTGQDIRDVMSNIGAKTELYLKSVAIPTKKPKDKFISFIDELAEKGIDQKYVGWFHDLRILYNKAKHDPTYNVSLLNATEVLQKGRESVEMVVRLGIGDSGQQASPQATRVYWISAYDHYIDGDTEVHIIIPGESEHWLGPPTFDLVNIKLLDWDEVKLKLSYAGVLKEAEGYIPKTQIELLKKDSDFLTALVWEGEYRDLLNILAQHELRLNLIAGLNRHDTGHYMQVAFLMAMLDVVNSASTIDELRAAIEERVTSLYGVPIDYIHKDHLLNGLITFINQVRPEKWSLISGPKWLPETIYSSRLNGCHARHENGYMLIDSEHAIVMKWKT